MTRLSRIAALTLAAAVATTMAVATAPASAAAKKPTATKAAQFGELGSWHLLNAELEAVGSTLYFTPSHEKYGVELWRTGGGKPTLVADLNTSKASHGGPASVDPEWMTTVGGSLFFFGDVSTQPNTMQQALFVVKSKSAKPVLLKKVTPADTVQPRSSAVAVVGKKLFFVGDDGAHGQELWVSDGTAKGTTLLKDINPGSYGSSIAMMTPVGNKLFFAANHPKSGYELWVSDGTPKGTKLVKDVNPGTGNGIGPGLGAAGSKVLFTGIAKDGFHRLYVSDGTAKGTKPLFGASSAQARVPAQFTQVGKRSYFEAFSGKGTQRALWVSDGTKKGTKVVSTKVHDFSEMVPFGKKLLFRAQDGKHGDEPWITDGTAKGTKLIKDMFPGKEGGYFGNFTVMGTWAYFVGPVKRSGTWTQQVFRTNGTKVQQLTNFRLGKGITEMTAAGNRLYFVMTEPYDKAGNLDRQLWVITG